MHAGVQEFDVGVAAEIMGNTTFNQRQAKTRPLRFFNGRTIAFPPIQPEAWMILMHLNSPFNNDIAFRNRQGAEFDRIGAQFMNRHADDQGAA